MGLGLAVEAPHPDAGQVHGVVAALGAGPHRVLAPQQLQADEAHRSAFRRQVLPQPLEAVLLRRVPLAAWACAR